VPTSYLFQIIKKIIIILLITSFQSYLKAQCTQSIAANAYQTIVVNKDGTLWSWGDNKYGQLGNGTNTTSTKPLQVGTATDWLMTSTTNSQTFAIKKNGTLWAWGYNYDGQLGDSTSTDTNKPIQIGTATDWQSVSVSGYVLAVKKDGTLWAWGSNEFYKLGDSTNIKRYRPTKIGTQNDWATVEAGAQTSYALKKDGSLWAWGANYNGQVGDGTNIDKRVPTRVGTSNDWAAIAAKYSFATALKKDGTLWAWGVNFSGQLGNGTLNDANVPTKIGVDTDWASMSTGTIHVVAAKKDGTLWAWGKNDSGQFGNGNTDNVAVLTPTKISTINNLKAVYTALYHTVALKKDGTLWAWGKNQFGQLGNNTNFVNSFTPFQIASVSGCATGSSEINISDSYKIFPNPTKDVLNIDDQIEMGSDIKIYNLTGTITKNVKATSNVIDVSQMPTGLYFISFTSNNHHIIKQFIRI
jgi:alpha-tubulin suppressor-like RCC1 family protein